MFLAAAKRTPVNLEEWAVQMMERHNRKSHLAPQLSPSTQALLRGEATLSPSKESSNASKTPTSGDIPFVEQDFGDLRITSNSDAGPSNIDSNGTGAYHSQPANYDQQGYQSWASRSRDADYSTTTTTLPIRPAPPPSGPLPQPPTTAFRNPNAKRPNGTSFPYSDPSQY